MWTKSIIPPLFLVIQFLVVFQISYGKPTTEEPFNHNATTEPVHIDVREGGEMNSTFLQKVSVLLTVLSPNDTATAEEDDTSPINTTTATTANSTTTEPEYYDDHNLTTSAGLNELVADDEEDNDLDMNLAGSTEPSALLSSLITDEMEVADSFDESVTTAVLTLKENRNSVTPRDEDGGTKEDDGGYRSRTGDGNNISANDGGSTSKRSHGDSPSTTDDSIIIASMSFNLNVDTVEPLTNQAITTDIPTKEEIILSSHHFYDSSSTSAAAAEPTFYSFTDTTLNV